MSDQPRYAFGLAVVGDGRVMTEDELGRLLDFLVARHMTERRIELLSLNGELAGGWAKARGFGIHHIPGTEGPVRQDCEIVVSAHAVVILGDPQPWDRLKRLCHEAAIPVQVYRTRPKNLPAPRIVGEW